MEDRLTDLDERVSQTVILGLPLLSFYLQPCLDDIYNLHQYQTDVREMNNVPAGVARYAAGMPLNQLVTHREGVKKQRNLRNGSSRQGLYE
jgi:hypothetical protein